MLVREGARAPEILMLKRHARSVFGDVHVFPGGLVDPCDTGIDDYCGSVNAVEADKSLGTANALCHYSAAIRELFEETGVLLAYSDRAGKLPAATSIGEAERRGLIDGQLAWDRLVRERSLSLATQELHYFAHWVTPKSEPKRFSTRFFVAVMPADQQAVHDGVELTDSRWMTANDVLEAQRNRQVQLIYPTYRSLRDIASFQSVSDIVDWADERQRSGIARVLPAIVEIDGKDKVILPGDPRYPAEKPE